MSTLNTTNLKNESSVTNNIVLGADGSVDLGTLEVNGAASVAPLVVSTDSTERARITSDGKLLVGTTTGNYLLTVRTDSSTNNVAKIGGITTGQDGGNYPSIGYNVRYGSAGVLNFDSSDTAAMIRFGSSSGRIETFTQSAGTAGNSIGFVTGPYVAVGGTSWTSSSDERLKESLLPLENALIKTCSLRAVTGRFKTDVPGKRRSFLIAQDVQAVLPEAVDDSNPESLGLDYSALIPLLVAAFKESKERIETLEAEVAALKGA